MVWKTFTQVVNSVSRLKVQSGFWCVCVCVCVFAGSKLLSSLVVEKSKNNGNIQTYLQKTLSIAGFSSEKQRLTQC